MQAGLAGTASALLWTGVADAAVAPSPGDAAILRRTLRIEQLVVLCYERVVASGLVAPAVAVQLRLMLAQEHEHVAALERALGGRVAIGSVAAAERELEAHRVHVSITGLRSQRDCMRLLIDVESLAEGAYYSAISKLTDPALLRTSAEAMGCEAQHWTVLSAIQHPGKLYRSVPYPFVQGSP